MPGVSYPGKTQTIRASLDTSAKCMSKSFAMDLDSIETALDTRMIELVATGIRAEQYR
jgi:hypothetical protein